MGISYEFTAKLEAWQTDGGGWQFVAVPQEQYQEMREIAVSLKHGFGSIKVEARIGSTTWQTSIFPDTENKRFLLFVKKAVRQAEDMSLGEKHEVAVTLLET
jgi:hypothetical protein